MQSIIICMHVINGVKTIEGMLIGGWCAKPSQDKYSICNCYMEVATSQGKPT